MKFQNKNKWSAYFSQLKKQQSYILVILSISLCFLLIVSCEQPVLPSSPNVVDVTQPVSPIPTTSSPTTESSSISGNFYIDSNQNSEFESNETAIANATIELYSDTNSDGVKNVGDVLKERTLTENDGSYTFSNLQTDVYLLVIPNISPINTYEMVAQSLVSIVMGANTKQEDNHFGFIPSNDQPDKQTSKQTISGHIYYDENNNGMFDTGDTGIEDVHVELYEDANLNGLKDIGETLIGNQNTPSTGGYRFDSIEVGVYALHIPAQYGQINLTAPITQTGLNPALSGLVEKEISSKSIQIQEGTDLKLNDFGYFTYNGPSISGKLYVDENQNSSFETGEFGLAQVELELYNDLNESGVYDLGDTLHSTTQTTTGGNYSFEDLGTEFYVLNIAADNPNLQNYELEEIPLFSLQMAERINVIHNDFKYIQTPPVAPSPFNVSFWPPNPDTTWQVQLARGHLNPVDTNIDADVYDIDIDSRQSIINELHNSGKKVICYIGGGTAEAFRPAVQRTFGGNLYNDPELLETWRNQGVIGNTYGYSQFENEFWMNPESPIVRTYLTELLDTCKAKGFDGVDIDNMDGFLWDKYAPEDNKTGFNISRETQVEFINWLGQEALDRGLLYGLKNTSEMTDSVHENASWAFLESCYSERMRGYTPHCQPYFDYFTSVGKSAYLNEYASVINPLSEEVNQTPTEIREQYCEWANEHKIFLMFRENDDEIERRLCP